MQGVACEGVYEAWIAVGAFDQRGQGGVFKGVVVDHAFLQAFFYVLAALFGFEGGQFEAEAHAAEQGLIDAQQQAGHEVLIAHEQDTEAGAAGFLVTVQQSYFFEGFGAEVLTFVQDDDWPAGVLLLQALVDVSDVVFAPVGRLAAQLASQHPDEAGAPQGAVAVEQWVVVFVVELAEQLADQVAFAHAVVAVNKTAVVQTEPVLEFFQLADELGTGINVFCRFGEGKAAGSPEAFGLLVKVPSSHSCGS